LSDEEQTGLKTVLEAIVLNKHYTTWSDGQPAAPFIITRLIVQNERNEPIRWWRNVRDG
jgi:hypothetical protein